MLDGDGRPFHDAAVRPADPDEVGAWLGRVRPARAALEVGELALADGVPFELDGSGFGRHTFLCGQSGSGKTYSLGVLLERLLMETGLRLVVLDPNSDYVRLAETRADADPAALARFAPLTDSIAVRSGVDGPAAIRVRFRELSPALQAAVLRLDPLADREEYAELTALVEDEGIRSLADLEQVDSKALKLRARNLGVERFGIWPGPEGESLLEELEDPAGPRCLVVDLGSLGTREEQALTASAVLERLWRRRAAREPIAIVIDEAHNVCPAEPGDPITALGTEDAIRIAGEGRKFGLYLIVVTQRPQKLHENVLSQCDNLVLMRMNSAADLDLIGRVFSFVPPGLIDRATTFRQGEALVAGKIASHPGIDALRRANHGRGRQRRWGVGVDAYRGLWADRRHADRGPGRSRRVGGVAVPAALRLRVVLLRAAGGRAAWSLARGPGRQRCARALAATGPGRSSSRRSSRPTTAWSVSSTSCRGELRARRD